MGDCLEFFIPPGQERNFVRDGLQKTTEIPRRDVRLQTAHFADQCLCKVRVLFYPSGKGKVLAEQEPRVSRAEEILERDLGNEAPICAEGIGAYRNDLARRCRAAGYGESIDCTRPQDVTGPGADAIYVGADVVVAAEWDALLVGRKDVVGA